MLIKVVANVRSAGVNGKSLFENGKIISYRDLQFLTNARRRSAIFPSARGAGGEIAGGNGATVSNHLTIDRILNVDEIGLSLERDIAKDSREPCFLSRRESSEKTYQRMLAFAYEHHVTCINAICAPGELGTMLVVFKGDHMPYLVVKRDGKEGFDTPANHLPRRSIVEKRKEESRFDSDNFFR